MILYLDSSAYVNNYILEAGRDEVAGLMEQAATVAAHELAYV